MYDTHAHLNLPEYLDRIGEVIDKCKKSSLTGIIVASANFDESKKAVDLAKKYPGFLYAMVGIHPHQVNSKPCRTWQEEIKLLDDIIEKNKEHIVAVGETGLDDFELSLLENKQSLEDQKELFNAQMKLAVKYNLPVVIHARGFVDETIEVISDFKNYKLKIENSPMIYRGGVFHCYAGGKKRIPKILELPGKWHFGIDGNVTYDQGLQNVVAEIPRDRLVLETDSPWLTPEPHRGKINSPAYLPLIAAQIAKIWQTTPTEVAKITTENTKNLFDI